MVFKTLQEASSVQNLTRLLVGRLGVFRNHKKQVQRAKLNLPYFQGDLDEWEPSRTSCWLDFIRSSWTSQPKCIFHPFPFLDEINQFEQSSVIYLFIFFRCCKNNPMTRSRVTFWAESLGASRAISPFDIQIEAYDQISASNSIPLQFLLPGIESSSFSFQFYQMICLLSEQFYLWLFDLLFFFFYLKAFTGAG